MHPYSEDQERKFVNYLKKHYKRTDDIDVNVVELDYNYWGDNRPTPRMIKDPLYYDCMEQIIEYYKEGFYK